MNSHEYAQKLKDVAEFLLSRPEFQFYLDATRIHVYFGSDKEKFVAAARALIPFKKEWTDYDLEVSPANHPEFAVYASRSAVCRKVQEEKWECEPLLSEAEEAEIGQNA